MRIQRRGAAVRHRWGARSCVLIAALLVLGGLLPVTPTAGAPATSPTSRSVRILASVATPGSQVGLPEANWPQLGHDPQRSSATSHTVDGPYRFYWRWTDVPLASRAQPVVAAGRLVIGSLNGIVYALDAAHDALGGPPVILWQHDLGSPIRAGAAFADDLVIVGTHHGTIVGLEAGSGQQRWSLQTDGAILAAPLVAAERVYLGSADGSLYALRANDGALLWQQSLGAPILASAALSTDGGTVFVATEHMMAYALATDTGTVRWQAQLQGQSAADRWPVVLDDLVIIRTQPVHGFHALLRTGDDILDRAGPPLADWGDDWRLVRPQIVSHLEAEPTQQTFFALDATTGLARGTAPVLYTYGNNDPPSPPAARDGQLYLPYRPRHGIQTDSNSVHVTSRYDAELGRLDPKTLDIAGLTATTTFRYQFRLTSDEPAIVTLAGDLLLVDSWERLGGIRLTNGELIGIAQHSHTGACNWGSGTDLQPVFEDCPAPAARFGEGLSRNGAVVAAGRIFWQIDLHPRVGLVAIGPAAGVTNPPATPEVALPPTAGLSGPVPLPPDRLAAFVWREPHQPGLIPADLRQRLNAEVKRIVQSPEHLMPFYIERGFHGRGSWPADATNGAGPANVGDGHLFWYDPGELLGTLAMAYPYLDPDLQGAVRGYLQTEMSRFPPFEPLPYPGTSWLHEGRGREPYVVPMRSSLNNWPPPDVPLQSIYALWTYARVTGDWAYVRSNWEAIRALFHRKRHSIDSYAALAGAIGYARLANQLGYQAEAQAGEQTAIAAMQAGYDFARWRDIANARYGPSPDRPNELPGRRAAVFFGLTPEVGDYLRSTNLAAVEETIGELTGYPHGTYLWYATRLGLQHENGETSFHSPEIGWSIFLAQAYIRHASPEQLRYWLDRPWAIGDLWHLQRLVATIEAQPATPPIAIATAASPAPSAHALRGT